MALEKLYYVVVAANVLIMIFSLTIIGVAGSALNDFEEAEGVFFEESDYLYFILGGVAGLIVSIIGCIGAKDPYKSYNLLFLYFVMLSVLFGTLVTGIYFYRVFAKNIIASGDGQVQNAVQVESAKEFNDLILSVYVECCSGCDPVAEPACLGPINGTGIEQGFCDVGGCGYPTICTQAQLQNNLGLGQGCFVNSRVIPSSDGGAIENLCAYFAFADDANDRDVVGDSTSGSCGGGDPRAFLRAVSGHLTSNYYLVMSVGVIMIIVVGLSWLGTFIMLLLPKDQRVYLDKVH